jgi:antitoxin component YwqK of YwqJK toxin-antitoxin module
MAGTQKKLGKRAVIEWSIVLAYLVTVFVCNPIALHILAFVLAAVVVLSGVVAIFLYIKETGYRSTVNTVLHARGWDEYIGLGLALLMLATFIPYWKMWVAILAVWCVVKVLIHLGPSIPARLHGPDSPYAEKQGSGLMGPDFPFVSAHHYTGVPVNQKDPEGRKQGMWLEDARDTYRNGKDDVQYREVWYKDDIKNGPHRNFMSGHRLYSDGPFANGFPCETLKFFYPDGTLKCEEYGMHGEHECAGYNSYWEGGVLLKGTCVKGDDSLGTHKEFGRDGTTLLHTWTADSHQKIGKETWYYPDGTVFCVVHNWILVRSPGGKQYDNENYIDGLVEWFFEDGSPAGSALFDKGVLKTSTYHYRYPEGTDRLRAYSTRRIDVLPMLGRTGKGADAPSIGDTVSFSTSEDVGTIVGFRDDHYVVVNPRSVGCESSNEATFDVYNEYRWLSDATVRKTSVEHKPYVKKITW